MLRFKKNLFFLSILFLLALIVGIFLKFPFKKKENAFCIPIEVAGYTDANIPFLKVKIEDREYDLILDLGFNGHISLKSTPLSEIKQKNFIKESYSVGFRGKEYPKRFFEMPEVKIDRVTFHSITLEESNPDFYADAVIIADETPDIEVAGSVGCDLFNNVVLCLDLRQSMIAICDSIESFEKEIVPLANCTKVPMLTDQRMIEFEALTSEGPLRCLLDSGCTSNLINRENRQQLPLQELIKNKDHHIKFDSFTIGEREFGPLSFAPIPLHVPFQVDAILGLEFLFKHFVVLDFVNRQVYIARSGKS